jgi:transposase
MKEKVTLNPKEQNRLMVLNRVETGKITGYQAAELMKVSLRHLKRLLAVYRKDGAAALAHGNRGRKPPNTLGKEIKKQVLELAQKKYVGFNTQHFTECLTERERIKISRSSVRSLLLSAGINSPRKRRAPKHRSRRERYSQEGMLLQIDGSPHDWLEGRGPSFTLIGAIDDATGKVPYAFFQKQEDSAGYFLLLREIVERNGIPLALYHDQHTIFDVPKNELESIEEQLEGRKKFTQFGRLLNELGITSISANSPQAKGRVERLWETFQDRLISELRLAGARNMEEANKVLADYLPIFNREFQVVPKEPGLAYRKPGQDFVPDRFFCFKYHRSVGGDNVVKFGGERLQILPSNGRLSYAHAQVEVHQRLDCTLAIYYQGQYLPIKPAPKEASLQRNQSKAADLALVTKVNDPNRKPAPDHPWSIPFKVLVK